MPFFDAQSAYRYLSQTASGAAAANPSVISRLNPTYAVNLANAVEAARAQGMNVGVGSAYRSPGYLAAQQRAAGKPLSSAAQFDAAGNSLHSYGLATDIAGLTDRNGNYVPALAKKFADIASQYGVYQPYGPNNRTEANHFQGVPYKTATPALRATLNADGTPKLDANGQPLYWSAVKFANPTPPVDVGQPPAASSQASDGSSKAGLLKTLFNAESYGGRNVPNVTFPGPGAGGGYFQIKDATWARYAKQVGVDTSAYPTAMKAPYSVQAQVAAAIPMGQWGARTLNLIRGAGYNLNLKQTLGENLANNGEPLNPNAGPPLTAYADQPQQTPAQQAIQNVTNPPGGTSVAPVSPRDYALRGGAAPGGVPAVVTAPPTAPAASTRTGVPIPSVPALGPGTTAADTGPAGMAQRVAAINPGLGRLGAGVQWSGLPGGVPAAPGAAMTPPAVGTPRAIPRGAPPTPVAAADEAYQSRAPVPVMPGVGALPALPYGAEAVLKAQYNNDPKALAAASNTIKDNVIAQHGYMGALLHQDAIKKEITDALGQATLADPVLGNQIKDNVARNPALTKNADPAGLAAMNATFAKLRPVTPTGSIPLPVARPDYMPPPAADTAAVDGAPAAPSGGVPVTPQQEQMARANRGWSAVQGSMAPPPPNRIPHIPDTLVRQTPDTLARRFANAFAPEPVPATVVPGTDITPAEYDPRQAPVRNLTVGMSGPDVMQVQSQLRALGFNPGAADGVYGPQTRAAVLRAQKAVDPKGYAGPNDGVAGVWTQGMLNRLLSSPAYGAAGARGPVPTNMSGPNIYGQPGGTVPLRLPPGAPPSDITPYSQPFSQSPAYGAAAARDLQGYPGLNSGFVTRTFDPNTTTISPSVGGAGIPFSTAAATPPGPPVGFGGRDFGSGGSTGPISFGSGSPYLGTSAAYSGALANAFGGGGSGAPFSGSGGYVPLGVGGGPDTSNNVMGGLLGGYQSGPAPVGGAGGNALLAAADQRAAPAADGSTPPAAASPMGVAVPPNRTSPAFFKALPSQFYNTPPPAALAGLIGPMPNPASDLPGGGQNRLPGSEQPPGYGRVPFHGIYGGEGYFTVQPPEALPSAPPPGLHYQLDQTNPIAPPPPSTDPRSFGYRPTLAQNQATGALGNILSGINDLFGVSPAEAAEAPSGGPVLAAPPPVVASTAQPPRAAALPAAPAASATVPANPFDDAANAPVGAANAGVVIVPATAVPPPVGTVTTIAPHPYDALTGAGGGFNPATGQYTPSGTAAPSGGPPTPPPRPQHYAINAIPKLVPTAPFTQAQLNRLIGGAAGSLLGPVGAIVGAMLGRGLAGGAASVGTPYQGAKSADYGLASGASSWGTPTYTAPGSAYSNSPFTPAGWTAPSFDTISGGPTYSYTRDPNTGRLSYINSAGNVVTVDSTSTTGAGANY